MNAIELRGVTAERGGGRSLRGVDLHVEAGEVVAVLGANGAGKSTTIRCVSGVEGVASGAVMLLGRDVTGTRPRARARSGLATVLDDRGIFTELMVAENLAIVGSRPFSALEEWFPALVPVVGRRAGLLSGGERTMLAVARALMRRPRALVVDELSTGLAPVAVRDALTLLRRLAAEWEMGVLIAEQAADAALEVADRAYLLRLGEVAFAGSAQALRDLPGFLASAYLGELPESSRGRQGSGPSETNP